ncbi:unnamed protein product, partial [Allacma fusca]
KTTHKMFVLMLPLCLAIFLNHTTAHHLLQYGIEPNYFSPNDNVLCKDRETNPVILLQQPTCSVSVEKLVDGLAIPGTSDRNLFAPPWMNYTLYRIGQQFAQENLIIISYCHYLAAVISYSDKDVASIFSTTGKSDTREKAILRNLANLKHTHLWYDWDLLSSDRISAASIHNLRDIHRNVAKGMKERLMQGQGLIDPGMYDNRTADEGLWSAVETDLLQSTIPFEWRQLPATVTSYKGNSVPLAQFVMSLAQFSFVGLPFVMPEVLEITKATDEQLLGWNHLWAVLAFALGIEDEFNIALQPSFEAIVKNYRKIFRTYVLQGFFRLSKQSKILMEIAASVSDEVLPNIFFSFSRNLIIHSV